MGSAQPSWHHASMAIKQLISLALIGSLAGCTFHSTARHFNGLVGTNGKAVYVKSTTNVGLNFAIALKLFGATTTDAMIERMTSGIAEEGGNRVRIIESSTENYWYGFPPFTWIFTPVITTVTADYEPAKIVFRKDRIQDAEDAKN